MKKQLLFALFLCGLGLSAFAQQYHMVIRTATGVLSVPVDDITEITMEEDDAPGKVLCYTILKEDTTATAVRMSVSYRSLSADCKRQQDVSGFISYPLLRNPEAMVLDNHYTMTDNVSVPSVRRNTDVSEALGGLFAGTYAFIAPDYIGYGTTTYEPHPYLCQRQNAANSIDLALVARDIFTARGITFVCDTLVNVGYSQGGGVAMAVHRELELDPALARHLHFCHTFCGDGPYDVSGTMEWMLGEAADKLELPVLLPLIVKGLLHGMPDYFHGRTFADFFRPEIVASGVEGWIDGHVMTTSEITSALFKLTGNSHRVADYFSDAVLDPNSSLHRELKEAIAACDLFGGWTATLPLTLFHLKNDGVVPVLNYYHAVEALGLDPAKQTLSESTAYTHNSYGTQFYLTLALSLASIIR